MKRARPLTRRAAAACLTLAIAACSISRRREIEMGAEYARQVNAELPIVRSSEVAAYLGTLGDSLARVAGTHGLAWHFYLVNSAEVNAFALPGGYVYVTRGLVERTAHLHHLAGVMAHEISHVTRRHAVRQLEAAQRANVGVTLACVLTAICESTAARVGIEVGGAVLFAKYSRDDERQADEDAVFVVVHAGISPAGIPEVLQRLLDERRERPAGVDAWFRTHPYEEERIAYTRAMIATLDSAQLARLTTDSPRFQDFRVRVLALPHPKEETRASRYLSPLPVEPGWGARRERR